MARVRRNQFWLDASAGGALTDYSADINSQALRLMREILEDTGINAEWKSKYPGIKDGQIPLNGILNDSSAGIVAALKAAHGTSVSTSWQAKFGGDYYYGECYVGDIEISGETTALATWSGTLEITNGWNETSVSQAA